MKKRMHICIKQHPQDTFIVLGNLSVYRSLYVMNETNGNLASIELRLGCAIIQES